MKKTGNTDKLKARCVSSTSKSVFLASLVFIFLFTINLISAVPPQTLSQTSLDLVAAYPSSHKLGNDYFIHVHVINTATESLVTSGVSCYYHFYNHQIGGNNHIAIGEMTQYGSGYNATIDGDLINQSGEYSTLLWCNSSNTIGDNKYTFEVTPSGFIGTTGFYILILILSLGLIILGLSIKDGWTVLLGSMGGILFGLFILLYGIEGIKDNVYTWGIGIITIMSSAYIGIRAALDQIE